MQPRDRLPELRRRAGISGDVCPAPASPPADIANILEEAARIRSWIQEVRRDTTVARSLLAEPAFTVDYKLQEQLDATVTNSNALGLKVCGALRQLEAAAGAARGAAGRVARLQHLTLRAHYADALHHHHSLLADIRDKQLRLLKQHARIMNLPMTEEECQSLLDADTNIALFVHNVRAETAEARLVLREAERRHAELARAEAALRDVRDLFVQLAALVAQQQEQIDTVEHYALQATDHVVDGQKQLLKGTVIRKRARKKKLSLIICLVSGFAIVLLVLVLT